jgi:hypothetical protein
MNQNPNAFKNFGSQPQKKSAHIRTNTLPNAAMILLNEIINQKANDLKSDRKHHQPHG